MKRFTPLLLLTLAFFTLFAPKARAAELWFNAGGVTYHDQPGRNNFNPGLGLELRLNDTWAVGLGKYRNSERHNSRYAGVLFTPFSVDTPAGRVFMGAQGGVIDGYPYNGGKPSAGGGLVAELRHERWAAAAVIVPASASRKNCNAVAFQFKFQIGSL
jgi:hypothetical protein